MLNHRHRHFVQITGDIKWRHIPEELTQNAGHSPDKLAIIGYARAKVTTEYSEAVFVRMIYCACSTVNRFADQSANGFECGRRVCVGCTPIFLPSLCDRRIIMTIRYIAPTGCLLFR